MSETNGVDNMGNSDSNILARIDERTQAQTIAFAVHVKDDSDRFDRVFNFISQKFDKVDERFDKIDSKLEPLQNESNQRKGAIGISKVFSAMVYSCIALAAGYFGGGVHKP